MVKGLTHCEYMIICSYKQAFKRNMRCKLSNEERMKNLICDIDEIELMEMADLFKMFSDSTRIKILYSLFDGEKNVGEICEKLDMNQSAISHQLKTLKAAKLVKVRREGKAMVYSLDDEHVKMIIAMGKEHIEED